MMHSFLLLYVVLSFSKLLVCMDLSTPAGVHFEETLTEKDFFSGDSNQPLMISYSVAITGLPDMPSWIKLIHNGTSSIVMYGTPLTSDIGKVQLSVVAWNKDLYETAIKEINLSITQKDYTSTKNQLEFKVKNKNIGAMISNCYKFLDTVKKSVWSGATNVVKCESVSDHTNMRPIPGQKEGVYVIVGGKSSLPVSVYTLKKSCQNITSIAETNNYFVNNGYEVDWCAMNRVTPTSSHTSRFQNGFEDTDIFFEPRLLPLESFDNNHQHLSLDVIYLFIPVVIGAMFIVVLTGIFCCEERYEKFTNNVRSKDHSRRQQPNSNKPGPPAYQKPPKFGTMESQL